MKRFNAFTLAEVLITLGVIGVVAAITLPNVIQNYKKKVATTRLKTFYSTMQQAFFLSEQENGDPKEWSVGDTNAYFNNYLAPYLKYLKSENKQGVINVYFANGSTVKIRYFYNYCTDFYYDINGIQKPNEEGKDMFRFLACPKSALGGFGDGKSPFTAYFKKNQTAESRLQMCKTKTTAEWCSGYLILYNFEFPKDYPYKL